MGGNTQTKFAPFNALLPRFRTYSKGNYYPGPGTYNLEVKPPPKITWPMKFGSPDWAQVPCLQKRTLKAELSTDKDFRKHRNRVAYQPVLQLRSCDYLHMLLLTMDPGLRTELLFPHPHTALLSCLPGSELRTQDINIITFIGSSLVIY
ncbi:hypothetical protein GH733_019687, partial [Mirounga leonina]